MAATDLLELLLGRLRQAYRRKSDVTVRCASRGRAERPDVFVRRWLEARSDDRSSSNCLVRSTDWSWWVRRAIA